MGSVPAAGQSDDAGPTHSRQKPQAERTVAAKYDTRHVALDCRCWFTIFPEGLQWPAKSVLCQVKCQIRQQLSFPWQSRS